MMDMGYSEALERLRGEIGQNGCVSVTSGHKRGKEDVTRHSRIRAVLAGRYVPDEANVDICLNCTKKKCTGSCKALRARPYTKRGQDDEISE